MHPRTLAILAFVLLVGSVGLRKVITYFGLLPVSEEVVLKKAVSLTVIYYDHGKTKSQVISDPAELKSVLALLKIHSGDDYFPSYYYGWNKGIGSSVQFSFPDGSRRSHNFEGHIRLGGYRVDEAFYNKLTEIISKREGKVIDLSSGPPVIPGQGFGFDDGKVIDPRDNPAGKGW